MDFKDRIFQFRDQVAARKEKAFTEEATKNALIMPFLQLLGYDVFDPNEVIPEMTCDIGTKKGEKVDYAIMKDEKPIILIECKHWEQDLSAHNIQLKRYYHESEAKFGVLTNGVVYKFYTDIVKPNVMDDTPFLEFNIEEDDEEEKLQEVKKFHKSSFDVEEISSSANDLKYSSELRALIQEEYSTPSDEFVKFFTKQVYEKNVTQAVIDDFRPRIKSTIESHYKSIILERFTQLTRNPEEEKTKGKDVNEDADETEQPENEIKNKIVTTKEELEGYYIVKSILRNIISSDRITYRDSVSYFSVVVDDSSRKPICRLHFNSANKRIGLLDENKSETRHGLSCLDDLYQFEEELKAAANRYQ